MYQYKGMVESVYDGDTCTILFDLGFNVFLKEKCRLFGINTPEIRTKNKKEKELGIIVRDFLREKILNKEVVVNTSKEGKYGRYLCVILLDGENINNLLVEKGYARRYLGGKREPWFPL